MEETLSREQKRLLIWYCFKRSLTIDAALEELHGVLEEACPSRSSIGSWYAEFRRTRQSVEDEPRTGRPPTAVTEENVNAVRELIESDPHITTLQMRNLLDIGSGALETILHQHLKVKKLCARWVPHQLTNEQKSRRLEFCQFMLDKFETADSRRWAEIYTTDEVWLYYYDIPLKRQSAMWVFEDDKPPVSVKRSRSVGKRMFAFFFNTSGVICTAKLENQCTVTSNWFTQVALIKFLSAIQERRPNIGQRGIHLHMDNAPAHTALATNAFLDEHGLKTLPHPPYSPDLSPCDFWLFPVLKEKLRGRRFETDNELEAATGEALEQIPKEDFASYPQKWISRMHKCIEVQGSYFEKV